jgi:hypothetical protein
MLSYDTILFHQYRRRESVPGGWVNTRLRPHLHEHLRERNSMKSLDGSVRKILFLVLLVFSNQAGAQDGIRFIPMEYELPGLIHDVQLEDVNRDGMLDLYVFHAASGAPESPKQRNLSLFLQHENGFSPEPHQTLPLDHGEILYDLADVTGDSSPELLFLTRTGIWIREYREWGYCDTLIQILDAPSLFLTHDPGRLRRWQMVRDLSGDEDPEILVPLTDRFQVYRQNAFGRFILLKNLWTTTDFRLTDDDRMGFHHEIPDLVRCHFNRDTIPDILLLYGDRVDVFLQPREDLQDADALTPPHFRYRLGARSIQSSALEALAPVTYSVDVADINTDGLSDILLTKAPRAGFTSHICQIQIYINRSGRLAQLPDQIITAENFNGEHILRDFNGDSRLDLAILTFKIGFTQAAKFLLTKKAGNRFDFYPLEQGDRFPERPAFRLGFSRPIHLGTLMEPSLCHDFSGDFNGDGLKDLLLETGSRELSIYLADPAGYFQKRAIARWKVRPSNYLHVADLNGNGLSGSVIWYPEDPADSGRLIVIQALRGGTE